MADSFNFASFAARWVFAVFMVFLTYNPSGYSYAGWILGENFQFGPVPVIAGLLLLVGWIIYLRASFLSLGLLGIGLGAALFACLIWLMVDLGWLSLDSGGPLSWIVLFMLSLLLGIGISWSHIRRRITGQIDVDDLDDGRG